MPEVSVLEKVEDYVRDLFAVHPHPDLLYHNLHHTVSVVQRVGEIGQHYQLPLDDLLVLRTAAWFHDIGQLFGPATGHEHRSVAQFEAFAVAVSLPSHFLQQVTDCILATKLPHHPSNFLEEIIRDADTYNLGTSAFAQNDALLKKEVALRTGKAPPDWDQQTLALLQKHVYYTAYCKMLLDEGKEKNYKLVAESINRVMPS